MVTPFQLELRQYVKAVVGGLLAALALLSGALGDGLSPTEVIALVVAFLTGFLGVFYAPNNDPKGVDNKGLSTQSGVITLEVVLLVVILVVLLALFVL